MSLVISVKKSHIDKTSELNFTMVEHCESVMEEDEFYIFLPLEGKLIPALTFLAKNEVSYELKNYSILEDQMTWITSKSDGADDYTSKA